MRFSTLSGHPLAIQNRAWIHVFALICLATWRKALSKAKHPIELQSCRRLAYSYLGMRHPVDESDEIYGQIDTLSIVVQS